MPIVMWFQNVIDGSVLHSLLLHLSLPPCLPPAVDFSLTYNFEWIHNMTSKTSGFIISIRKTLKHYYVSVFPVICSGLPQCKRPTMIPSLSASCCRRLHVLILQTLERLVLFQNVFGYICSQSTSASFSLSA